YVYTGAVQSDGALVVLGTAGSEGGSPRLFRVTPTGAYDHTWGNSPSTLFGATIDISNPNAAVIQTVGTTQRAVIGGALNSGEWQLERYDSTGNPDSTFGTAGVVTKDFGGTSFGSAIFGLAVDSNQDILAAGGISNIQSALTNGVPTP